VRTRPSKRARLFRRLRASFVYYVAQYTEPVNPYVNLNVSAPMPTLENL
jgi:hypothetical protein